MSTPASAGYTDPVPKPLLLALEQGRLIAFIGAGISRRCFSRTRAPLPGWSGLLSELVKWSVRQKLVDTRVARDLEELLQRDQLLVVAQECRDLVGDSRLGEFIADVFDPDGVVPARVHELLSAVPFRGYVTTNFDNLLERAYARVHNRQLHIAFPETMNHVFKSPQGRKALLKLHGDLDDPASVVLGHRDYLRMVRTPQYAQFMRDLMANFTLLFVGYGLTDPDVLLCLDDLTQEGVKCHHFLLSQRGTRNAVEKKRLLLDRQVEVLEYVDYFGLHNHVDTFLEALLLASGHEMVLRRVRRPLRSRMQVHYNADSEADGLFVWNYVFREGAITLSDEPQRSQWCYLKESITEGLQAVDCLVFLVTRSSLADSDTTETIASALKVAGKAGVHTVFLAVGFEKRPQYLARVAPSSPIFLLPLDFSEFDLEPFRQYLAEEIRGGFRQL